MFKIKVAAFILALVMILGTLAGCGEKAQSVMTFRENVIDENEYCYMMSNYKAIYLYNLFGMTQDNPSFWTNEISDGITVSDYLSALANSTILSTVLYLGLFDEYGLSLSTEELAAVDAQMDSFIKSAGGKSALNSNLAAYGANVDTMKNVMIDSLKINKLKAYLYGENGIDLATADEIDAYYKEKYMCTKLIFISATKDYEYDENGEMIFDESTNSYKTRDITEEEKAAKKVLFDEACARVDNGEDFDELMEEYTMNIDMLNYEDGYYVTESSTFLEQAVMTTLSELEIGESTSLETASGWYIVKRCELRDKAYADEKYTAVMFSDLIDNIHTAKMQKKIEPYVDEVVMDKDLMSTYPISACTPNFSILTSQIPG